MRVILLLLLIAFFLNPVAALALNLGQNITIWDGNGPVPATGDGEDGETEPGMVNEQKWDLEGFFFDDQNTLSMVGGYNFKDGQEGYTSGDIFISVGAAPVYGDIHRNSDGIDSNNGDGYNKQNTASPLYGYHYVLDLNFSGDGGGTYTVFGLGSGAILQTAYYQQNEGSSPWKYVSGGIATSFGGSFSFIKDLTAVDTGFLGTTHYALSGFDLSFLAHGTNFFAHYTMGCGNDNLMGQGTVVPEPSTFLLFAAGGSLLWLNSRRKRK